MRARLAAAFATLLFLGPAHAQTERPAPAAPRPAQQQAAPPRDNRPAWAADMPLQPPPGTIGIMAAEQAIRSSFCELQVLVLNKTDATIRYASVQVEVFFGDRSVIARFPVELVDPDRSRISIARVIEGCPRLPTRMVVREVSLCSRPNPRRRGCGAPFVAFMPGPQQARTFPVEIAPDYER